MTYETRRLIKEGIDRARREALAYSARLYVQPVADLPDGTEHGTANAYTNYYCRCDPCRASESARQAARRAREKLEAAA